MYSPSDESQYMWPSVAQKGAFTTDFAPLYHHGGFFTILHHKGNKLGNVRTAKQFWRVSSPCLIISITARITDKQDIERK
jgi:hypothetical protein